MRRGGLRGGLDLLKRRVGAAKGDVVADRATEQIGLLQHDADLRAQAVDRQVAEVVAVDQDRALAGVVEARDQVDDRALAAAGGAQQRDSLARLGRKADVVQHGRAAAEVAEAHIPELDPALDGRQRQRAGFFDNIALGIKDLENPPSRGRGLRHQRDDKAQLAEREEHIDQVQAELLVFAEVERAAQHLPGAEIEHRRLAELRDQEDQREQEREHPADHARLLRHQRGGRAVEALGLVGLAREAALTTLSPAIFSWMIVH